MTTILDGGMGQELVARSGDRPTALWSTRVMLDHPELVRAVHDDYFAAGAQIATANTYAIHHDRLIHADLDTHFAALHQMACRMAVEARDAHGSGQVAGSLGPLGASYRPDLAPPPERAAALYLENATLQAPYVDFFICETMSSLAMIEGAMMGALPLGKPVWIAVSVQDTDGTRLRSGEPVADVLPVIARHGAAALLVNCSIPEAVTQALACLTGCPVPLGAYANGFTRITEAFLQDRPSVDALTARKDLDPDAYAGFAETWIGQGASIVGGCCEVGPAHIRELARRFGG